jgi:hypothetical protein
VNKVPFGKQPKKNGCFKLFSYFLSESEIPVQAPWNLTSGEGERGRERGKKERKREEIGREGETEERGRRRRISLQTRSFPESRLTFIVMSLVLEA